MKPQGYTHRESGDNFLLGVALLEAWRRQDRHSWAALLHIEHDNLDAALVAVCRAASNVISQLAEGECDVASAMDAARDYGRMRRDDLGGDEIVNRSNKKG